MLAALKTKNQGTTKVMLMHPLGTMGISTRVNGSTYYNFQEIIDRKLHF